MILLIDNYDSFTYNLYHLIGRYCPDITILRNDQICLTYLFSLYEKGELEAIVLSPGPGRPEKAGKLLLIIEKFLGKVPILGVCLGHQAIGMVFGAKVIKASKIYHGKPSTVIHSSKGLYKGLNAPLIVARYHSLCIDMKSAKNLSVDATTLDETIMGISNKNMDCYGLQFHPESVLTEKGDDLMLNFFKTIRKNERGLKRV